jgi:hypothetical protein
MQKVADLLSRYRIVAGALAVSAAVHAAVMVGVPARFEALADNEAASYSATLDPAAEVVALQPAPAPTPGASRRPAKPRAKPQPSPVSAVEEEPGLLAGSDAVPGPAEASPAPVEPTAIAEAKPEVVALAQPAVPVPALEAPRFPVAALPANVSITYQLTSAFAEGRAVYKWERDGDNYRITGEAEAVGFFTLFLEGRILQESRGTVSGEGLRPDRFVERKPGTAPEGLEFDWPGRKVTFDRNANRKTEELTDNTVDWLSMIFQMAHMPPSGEAYELRVFTQRRYYKFNLKVLGNEEIDIPMGRVKALHLRHVDPQDQEVVDVWLGVDQYYLPVKLRYPVARNRLTVEQTATRVSAP